MLLPYTDALERTFSVGRAKKTGGLPLRQQSSATRMSDAVRMFPLTTESHRDEHGGGVLPTEDRRWQQASPSLGEGPKRLLALEPRKWRVGTVPQWQVPPQNRNAYRLRLPCE